jgi:two-component system C4-dicarboxylate transport response regulator DctD
MEQPPSAAPTARRILYIDDDESFSFLVKAVCERRGHTVTTYADPYAALAAVDLNPDAWDLVITDHRMPGADGFEIARTLRERHPALACVMISNHVTDALTKDAMAIGVRRFLHKPYKADHLVALIELATR